MSLFGNFFATCNVDREKIGEIWSNLVDISCFCNMFAAVGAGLLNALDTNLKQEQAYERTRQSS